jgi:hypothetical protein
MKYLARKYPPTAASIVRINVSMRFELFGVVAIRNLLMNKNIRRALPSII